MKNACLQFHHRRLMCLPEKQPVLALTKKQEHGFGVAMGTMDIGEQDHGHSRLL